MTSFTHTPMNVCLVMPNSLHRTLCHPLAMLKTLNPRGPGNSNPTLLTFQSFNLSPRPIIDRTIVEFAFPACDNLMLIAEVDGIKLGNRTAGIGRDKSLVLVIGDRVHRYRKVIARDRNSRTRLYRRVKSLGKRSPGYEPAT